MLKSKDQIKIAQPTERSIETLIKSLPVGWIVTITTIYIVIGRSFYFNFQSLATFNLLLSSLALAGFFAGVGTWARTLILNLVKTLIAATALTRAIMLVSIYYLIVSLFLDQLLPYTFITRFLFIPWYLYFVLGLLWIIAVIATKLLVKFNQISTFLILLGFSLLGLGLARLTLFLFPHPGVHHYYY